MAACLSLLWLPRQNTIDWVAKTTEINLLILLEAGKSRIKVLDDSVSGGNPLSIL